MRSRRPKKKPEAEAEPMDAQKAMAILRRQQQALIDEWTEKLKKFVDEMNAAGCGFDIGVLSNARGNFPQISVIALPPKE